MNKEILYLIYELNQCKNCSLNTLIPRQKRAFTGVFHYGHWSIFQCFLSYKKILLCFLASRYTLYLRFVNLINCIIN